MTQKYYLSTFMKTLLILAAIMVVILTAVQLLLGKYISLEIPGAEIMFGIADLIIIGIIIWRIKTPLVEISDTGIKVGVPFLFKTNTAKWDEIEGITINDISNLGIKERQVKILIKTEGTSTKEMGFSLRAVEKPEEIISELRAKIPEKGYEDIRKSPVLQKPVGKEEITYRGWTAMERGLSSKRDFIPWDMIRELKYPALVIGGYGATTVNYIGSGGMKRNITIKASISEEYLTFLRYLIQRSHKAIIDPAILKVLEYPPKDARADMLSIVLFVTGITLFFISMFSIAQYSPTIFSSNIYPLLAILFAGVPIAMSVKLFAGRFRGKTAPAKKKLIWTSLINAGAIISIPVFFIISPFSFHWVMGDVYKNTESFDKAEYYYSQALVKIPDSIDILYEMGKLYRKQEKWEKASDYLQRAYIKDPSYWGPLAVELIPDTFMKMGKHDIALQWCERILKDHPNKIDIAKTISKKQDEIISERGFVERENMKKNLMAEQPSAAAIPSGAEQSPKPVVTPEKGAKTTESQKTDQQAGAQTPLMFPQSSLSKRCSLAPSSGIIRLLSGDYTGNKTIDLSINIIFYIYFCLCLFLIAKKLRVNAPWTAWIPIVNLWTLVSSAGKPWWWILLLIIPLANIIVWISLWMCMAENTGKNKWLGLLMLVPFASFVFIGMLAFSGNEKMGEPAAV